MEYKWKGPYHIARLGHPGTYLLMTSKGDILPSFVNQRDLAPFLAQTRDSEDYFYDGTTDDNSYDTTQAYLL